MSWYERTKLFAVIKPKRQSIKKHEKGELKITGKGLHYKKHKKEIHWIIYTSFVKVASASTQTNTRTQEIVDKNLKSSFYMTGIRLNLIQNEMRFYRKNIQL